MQFKHIVKKWNPNPLLELDINFVLNRHVYHIYPSSIHGLGLFYMDCVNIPYKCNVDLMQNVGQLYKYGDWMILTNYMKRMWTYELSKIITIEK
jgi:hypothetical protein